MASINFYPAFETDFLTETDTHTNELVHPTTYLVPVSSNLTSLANTRNTFRKKVRYFDSSTMDSKKNTSEHER